LRGRKVYDSEKEDFIPGGFEVRKMASKQTYECYVCKRNGFPETRVYLDGKTEDGKTIYKNEDMSTHQHKQQQQQPQSQSEPTYVRVLNAKLDRIIALLNKEQL
jgi:hypothetical protein